ncbi:MAG: RQC domain-containing protein [Bulleidia sp.]|nr:RQC domain-containing protein [Bulleidia sp.]
MDVVQGSSSKIIQKDKLYNMPQFGLLKHVERQKLIICTKFLIEHHFLLQTRNTRYPVVHMTYEGNHYAEYMTDTMVKRLSTELNE